MKATILGIILSVHFFVCPAQTDSTAPYWKNRQMPAFSLLRPDSSLYTNKDLDSAKSTLIMLFNPECEHCQDQYKLLTTTIPQYASHIQVILSATETMEKIRIFAGRFDVSKYPYIHLVRDHKYQLGPVFQPKTIPVLILYDRHQQFMKINQGALAKKELLIWLQEAADK